ncbi:MAG: hypothetical protein LUD50_01525 [Clostridia bacterium]|nr:hypothetical protein [Clostridia bacterium]
MAKDKKSTQAEAEKEFDFNNAGFCFCAEAVSMYGEENYRQSTDILMDQLVESSIDAGQHITAFTTVPEAFRPDAAVKCIERMDKTMFLAFMLVKLGILREKHIDNLVALARAIKHALYKYLPAGEVARPVDVEEGDDDGFYDSIDLSPMEYPALH